MRLFRNKKQSSNSNRSFGAKKLFAILALFFIVSTYPSMAMAASTSGAGGSASSFLTGYICTPDNTGSGSGLNIPNCINNIYIFAVAFVGFMSVLIIVFAGYLYMSGGSENITKAKEYISGVIAALVILFSTYAILNTINPNLTNLNSVIVPNVNCGTSGSALSTLGNTNPSQCALSNLNIGIQNNNVVNGGNNGSGTAFIFDGYNLTSYSTNPSYGPDIIKIYNGLNGVKTDAASMNAYIKSKAPQSPITGDMIDSTVKRYGTDPKMIMAIMQEESMFGTTGLGAKNHNPGNVGNNDNGGTADYGTWQDGVDAIAGWLEGHLAQ